MILREIPQRGSLQWAVLHYFAVKRYIGEPMRGGGAESHILEAMELTPVEFDAQVLEVMEAER